MRIGIFTIVCYCMLLQGCVDAAISGAQVAYNRHTLQHSFNDHYIALRSSQAIYVDTDRYNDTHVSVSAFNHVVVLTGQVSSALEKNEIATIAKNVSKAKDFYNFTYIGAPPSVLTQLSDSWITAKIKGQLMAINDIDPNQIKIITENGTVYLMGIIPHQQADIAIDIARTTAGVQNVVKIFSYLTITKA